MLSKQTIFSSNSSHLLVFSLLLTFQVIHSLYIVARLWYQSSLLYLCLYTFPFHWWLLLYLTFISALVLIIVHSYYSWTQNHQGDHLTASFMQFMKSSHHTVIASAIEKAIDSYGEDTGCLCEEILQIIKNHPLGRFILEVHWPRLSLLTPLRWKPTLSQPAPLRSMPTLSLPAPLRSRPRKMSFKRCTNGSKTFEHFQTAFFIQLFVLVTLYDHATKSHSKYLYGLWFMNHFD